MNASIVKQIVIAQGAQVCGIAPVHRFADEPIGFRPQDIFKAARTVIAFGIQTPETVLFIDSYVPYSVADDISLHEISRISISITLELERRGMKAVPIPSEPYDFWDVASKTGKGLMNLKTAAYFAGLGLIGKNQLLCNPKFGNLLKLGAVLIDGEFEGDSVLSGSLCPVSCGRCVDACPSGALSALGVVQAQCRPQSEGQNSKGKPLTVCFGCRKVCPNRAGWKTVRA